MQEILLKMVIHKSLLYAFFVFMVFQKNYIWKFWETE